MGYQYRCDSEDTYRYLKDRLEKYDMPDALRALDYCCNIHKDDTRMNGDPYIVHPLSMAKYALCLGIRDEAVIASLLLHDVCEDHQIPFEDLPFNAEIREIVGFLTIQYYFEPDDDEAMRYRKKIIAKWCYFANLLKNEKALLCKAIDRYDNLSTIEDLGEVDIVKNIFETHTRLLPVLEDGMKIYPESYDRLYALVDNLRALNGTLAKHYHVRFDVIPS